ncbi:hypothetical protein RhiXN_00591 [Rhizoctonia solani]|uniref:Domain of unknown function at the cortex 1 domain-containing protein n=1 Tax=Rhizoctonia solani TaxID=456999 RepID=A0A8H8NV35_9AGAM|nr:uncharacterized protein RhiXN_00591 [Rhizoctonia solani]QRW19185.1 hypothetical protein RhiXN_00591 [Rhizoctonia solani]
MPYRLSVTAGPSLDLSTHNPVDVNNDDCPVEIYSPHFRGRITVRVKNLPEDQAPISESRYFNNKSATFSLQCQGQYGNHADELNVDDIMFGIVLQKPLSDTPPLGLSLIERTMRFFWPVMESNLQDHTPWVLSPMFATMSRVRVQVGSDPIERELGLSSPAQNYFRESLATNVRSQLPRWPGIMTDAESESIPPSFTRRPPNRTPRSRASSSSPPPTPRRSTLSRTFSYFSRAAPQSLDVPGTPQNARNIFISSGTKTNTHRAHRRYHDRFP